MSISKLCLLARREILLSVAVTIISAGCATKQSPPPVTSAAPPVVAAAPRTVAGTAPLFDGKTLTGWTVTDFAGHGTVRVEEGKIILDTGHMTGITWTNDLPRVNYEVSLDAMRVEGSDFFCGLTFPVGNDPCSFIVGGWGGGVVGLSSIDSEDASQNESTSYMNFMNNRWYHIRVRVMPKQIQAWIDEERVVNVETEGKRLSIRLEVEPSKPLGIATWNTAAALKNIRLRTLGPDGN
jgi:hypothetical protein